MSDGSTPDSSIRRQSHHFTMEGRFTRWRAEGSTNGDDRLLVEVLEMDVGHGPSIRGLAPAVAAFSYLRVAHRQELATSPRVARSPDSGREAACLCVDVPSRTTCSHQRAWNFPRPSSAWDPRRGVTPAVFSFSMGSMGQPGTRRKWRDSYSRCCWGVWSVLSRWTLANLVYESRHW